MEKKWWGWTFYVVLFIAISWWDFWYPELTETAGIYEVVYEETTVQIPTEMIECELNEENDSNALNGDCEEIRFRFRLWEWIEEYF